MKRNNDLRIDWGSVMLSWGFVSIAIGVVCLAATWASVYFLADPSSSSNAGTQAMMGSLFFSFIAFPLLFFGTIMVILGFVFRRPQEKPQKACPNCGRLNAQSTETCPRCMEKIAPRVEEEVKSVQLDGVACGECGRVNAVTTRICPRCMTKV